MVCKFSLLFVFKYSDMKNYNLSKSDTFNTFLYYCIMVPQKLYNKVKHEIESPEHNLFSQSSTIGLL